MTSHEISKVTWNSKANQFFMVGYQLEDEPNLYMGNGWKSPNIYLYLFINGCLGFQVDFKDESRIYPRVIGTRKSVQRKAGTGRPTVCRSSLRLRFQWFFFSLGKGEVVCRCFFFLPVISPREFFGLPRRTCICSLADFFFEGPLD